MQRLVSQDYAELIRTGLDSIPEGLARRVEGVHFFTGIDGVWAGIEEPFDTTDNAAWAGRNPLETWYVTYDTLDDTPTVVLPVLYMPMLYPNHRDWYHIGAVVHEVGHVLHARMDWEQVIAPFNDYAEHNDREAFAESFTAYCATRYSDWILDWMWEDGERDKFEADKETLAFWDKLAEV